MCFPIVAHDLFLSTNVSKRIRKKRKKNVGVMYQREFEPINPNVSTYSGHQLLRTVVG